MQDGSGGKAFALNTWRPKLSHKNSCKKSGILVGSCKPTGGTKEDRDRSGAHWPVSRRYLVKYQASEILFLKAQKVTGERYRRLSSDLRMNVHTGTYTHQQNNVNIKMVMSIEDAYSKAGRWEQVM